MALDAALTASLATLWRNHSQQKLEGDGKRQIDRKRHGQSHVKMLAA